MAPFRLEREGMVERCDPIDLTEWDMQFVGDEAQRCVIEIAKRTLHRVQRLDESIWSKSISTHRSDDHPPSFFIF